MAEYLAKIDDGTPKDCTTGDNDGMLITALVQALGTPATQGFTKLPLWDNGASQPSGVADGNLWAASSVSGRGYDMFFRKGSVNECVILEDYALVGDVTGTPDATLLSKIQGDDVYASISPSDGDVLTWDNGNSRWDATAPSAGAHAIGGASHTTDSLTNLNSKITGGSLDFTTASRPPSGNCSGDLGGTYPGPSVNKLRGYGVTAGSPTLKDILQWSGSSWNHVSGLAPHYDSGWFQVNVNSSYSKTHSLGVLPRQVQVYVSTNSNGNPCQLAGWGWMHGEDGGSAGRGTIVCDITTTALTVRTGSKATPYGVFDSFGFGGTRVNLGNLDYARVLCWK